MSVDAVNCSVQAGSFFIDFFHKKDGVHED